MFPVGFPWIDYRLSLGQLDGKGIRINVNWGLNWNPTLDKESRKKNWTTMVKKEVVNDIISSIHLITVRMGRGRIIILEIQDISDLIRTVFI